MSRAIETMHRLRSRSYHNLEHGVSCPAAAAPPKNRTSPTCSLRAVDTQAPLLERVSGERVRATEGAAACIPSRIWSARRMTTPNSSRSCLPQMMTPPSTSGFSARAPADKRIGSPEKEPRHEAHSLANRPDAPPANSAPACDARPPWPDLATIDATCLGDAPSRCHNLD